MITGELFISTTWAASTSFIPFDVGMRDAQCTVIGSVANRGFYSTTAYVHGVWDYQVYEQSLVDSLDADDPYVNKGRSEEIRGLGGGYYGVNNAFTPGTVIETKVRKLKALKVSPNRSGVQISRRLLKGNKIVFKYLAIGELVRP